MPIISTDLGLLIVGGLTLLNQWTTSRRLNILQEQSVRLQKATADQAGQLQERSNDIQEQSRRDSVEAQNTANLLLDQQIRHQLYQDRRDIRNSIMTIFSNVLQRNDIKDEEIFQARVSSADAHLLFSERLAEMLPDLWERACQVALTKSLMDEGSTLSADPEYRERQRLGRVEAHYSACQWFRDNMQNYQRQFDQEMRISQFSDQN